MQETPEIKDKDGWLETVIKDFINKSPENTLKNQANDKAFDDPWWDSHAAMIQSIKHSRSMSDFSTGPRWKYST